MQKEKYIRALMEITEFETEDVMTSSAVEDTYDKDTQEIEILVG